MVDVLAISYLSGWVVATLVAYAAAKRFSELRSPAVRPITVSLLAGAVWPLLVIGLVELSSVIVYTKVQSKPGPGVGIFA